MRRILEQNFRPHYQAKDWITKTSWAWLNSFGVAAQTPVGHVSDLELPRFLDCKELSLLYHRPELFPELRRLRANDKYDDGEVRAIAGCSIWRTLEVFETEPISESCAHSEPSRTVPLAYPGVGVRHVATSCDLTIPGWNNNSVFCVRLATTWRQW